MLLFNRSNGLDHELLLEAHHVLVGVNPAHLHVDGDELGRVAGGEGGVCPEDGSDLEDSVETSAHSHLLIKLRRLGEVGVALEVLELEKFSVRL